MKVKGSPHAGPVRTIVPVMLPKLKNRDVRDSIILKRKLLKGTPYSIDEDLTTLNVQLMTRLRNHERVTQTWSWNGKVFATLDNDKTIIAKPLSSVQEMFSFPAILFKNRNKSD